MPSPTDRCARDGCGHERRKHHPKGIEPEQCWHKQCLGCDGFVEPKVYCWYGDCLRGGIPHEGAPDCPDCAEYDRPKEKK